MCIIFQPYCASLLFTVLYETAGPTVPENIKFSGFHWDGSWIIMKEYGWKAGMEGRRENGYGTSGESLGSSRVRAGMWSGISGIWGNTSCVTVHTKDKTVILDAGTGIGNFDRSFKRQMDGKRRRLDLLLSHFHMDHLMGLYGCSFLLIRRWKSIFMGNVLERKV